MGTLEEHPHHDAPRSAAPAESLEALATPQGVGDRFGTFSSSQLPGLFDHWGENREGLPLIGCRKVTFYDGADRYVGEAWFFPQSPSSGAKAGVAISFEDGRKGMDALAGLDEVAERGGCSYRAFREVSRPSGLSGILPLQTLVGDAASRVDFRKALSVVHQHATGVPDKPELKALLDSYEASHGDEAKSRILQIAARILALRKSDGGAPAASAESSKHPDRRGYFFNRSEFLGLLSFWATTERIARRVDFYSQGQRFSGSIWFGPKGIEAAQSYGARHQDGGGAPAPSGRDHPFRLSGWDAVQAILAMHDEGRYSYRAYRGVVPGTGHAGSMQDWTQDGFFLSAIGELENADGAARAAMRGISLSVPDGLPRELGTFLGWTGDLVVTICVGFVVLADPRDGFRIVRRIPFRELLIAEDPLSAAVRADMRAAFAVSRGLASLRDVTPIGDFTPHGYGTFIQKGADGRWARHVAHVSGRVVPVPADAFVRQDGGMIWVEFPAAGTARFLGAKGEFDPREYVRIARAGAVPLWTLERASKSPADKVRSILQDPLYLPSASVLDALLSDDDDAPRGASVSARVQVANGRLEMRDVPAEYERAALDPQFWDGPLDGAAQEWRDDVLAWASS